MKELNWESITAKNGEQSLMLNGYQIYSKYTPKENVHNWIESEVDLNANCFLLVGLGLGYHLEYLLNYTERKRIYVYYFDQKELDIFNKYSNEKFLQLENIKITQNIEDILNEKNLQVLVPHSYIKAIGKDHPLNNILEVMKINQISYKRFQSLMHENFEKNISNKDNIIKNEHPKNIGCLVAAGPSLDQTVQWLKENQKFIDIFVVGAALKTVLENNILPSGVVISDASDLIEKQFEGVDYKGSLFYLCTSHADIMRKLKGDKYILFQQGFFPAEQEAANRCSPLLDTGGSVGTVTFSLMEELGYETIVLFGQDLGFPHNKTHTEKSSSNQEVNIADVKRKIRANNGEMVNTNLMLYSFWNWYEEKCKNSPLKIYNTALQGAKISNTILINREEFNQLIKLGK